MDIVDRRIKIRKNFKFLDNDQYKKPTANDIIQVREDRANKNIKFGLTIPLYWLRQYRYMWQAVFAPSSHLSLASTSVASIRCTRRFCNKKRKLN